MASALNTAISKGNRSLSGIEGALLKALGGNQWMHTQSTLVDSFSPNNIQLLAIAYDCVIVKRYIEVDKKPKILAYKFDPYDTPKKQFALNRILEHRKMSGLEELIIWQGYARPENGYFDLESFKSVYTSGITNSRVRYIGMYDNISSKDIHDIFVEKKSALYCASDYLAKRYGAENLCALYQNNTITYAKVYRLDPTHYYLDRSNGPLQREYSRIQTAVLQWRVTDRTTEIMRNDIANYRYYAIVRPMLTTKPETEAQSIVRDLLRKAKETVNQYGKKIPAECISQAYRELRKYHPEEFDGVPSDKSMLKMLTLMEARGVTKGTLSLQCTKIPEVPAHMGLINIKGIVAYAVVEAYKKISSKGEKEKELMKKMFGADLLERNIQSKRHLDEISLDELCNMLTQLYNLKVELSVDEKDLKRRHLIELQLRLKEKAIKSGMFDAMMETLGENNGKDWKEEELERIRIERGG